LFAPFESTGLRVPAFVISPFVSPKRRYSARLDHTAILHFLGQKFGGGTYSDTVSARQAAGRFGSVMDVLDRATPRNDIPRAPDIPDLPVPSDDVMTQLKRKRDTPTDLHVLCAMAGLDLHGKSAPPKGRRSTKRKTPTGANVKPAKRRRPPGRKS
jgi:hypothetical protein